MTNNIEPIRVLYVDDETELLNVGKLFIKKMEIFLLMYYLLSVRHSTI